MVEMTIMRCLIYERVGKKDIVFYLLNKDFLEIPTCF